jgi:hypothetical protein
MQANESTPNKILVGSISRNKFLSPAGRWVKKTEAAFHFPNLLSAINTCFGRRLKDVELILHYGQNLPEQRFPLDMIQ